MGSSPSIRLPLELMARLQFLFQHQRIRLHNWFPGWREQLHPGGGGGGGGGSHPELSLCSMERRPLGISSWLTTTRKPEGEEALAGRPSREQNKYNFRLFQRTLVMLARVPYSTLWVSIFLTHAGP